MQKATLCRRSIFMNAGSSRLRSRTSIVWRSGRFWSVLVQLSLLGQTFRVEDAAPGGVGPARDADAGLGVGAGHADNVTESRGWGSGSVGGRVGRTVQIVMPRDSALTATGSLLRMNACTR